MLAHIVGMQAETLLMSGRLNKEQVALVYKVQESQECRMQSEHFVIITPGINIVG